MFAATLAFGERDHLKLDFFANKIKGKKSGGSGHSNGMHHFCVYDIGVDLWWYCTYKAYHDTADSIPGDSYGICILHYACQRCTHKYLLYSKYFRFVQQLKGQENLSNNTEERK